ncbi:uncharacterized protein LOC132285361 [Cornus florida]|uniref:uncharacterized protein LOC132285361 n=1 Tax=Cornus florida TaxID=4283 RepID=UPI0028A1270E|nr:uncharacterized protein LOC132285361 [Cornus florida]
MVAREKVMEPITFQGCNNFTSRGCMTLRECVVIELAAHIGNEYKLMGRSRKRKYSLKKQRSEEMKLSQIHEELKEAMVSTLLLLEIFERAGDKIEAHSQLEQPNKSHQNCVRGIRNKAIFSTEIKIPRLAFQVRETM